MKLTQKELKLIQHALNVTDGFLDFENNSDEEFLQRYGLEKDEVDTIVKSLGQKVRLEQGKLKQKIG